MDILIAGLASGAFMAQVFIMVGCLTAFFALKNPPPALAGMLERFSPAVLVAGIVVAAYPTWGVVGVVLAFLFVALENGFPGSGLGSPNLAYSVGVTLASLALAAPIAILAQRLWVGVVSLTAASVGIYGWLLPLLAS